MNIKKLKAKCVEKGYTAGQLAKKIKIGRTAMSYKINQHKPHDTRRTLGTKLYESGMKNEEKKKKPTFTNLL